jgi:DNA-binding transcriptional ArsR family regulator
MPRFPASEASIHRRNKIKTPWWNKAPSFSARVLQIGPWPVTLNNEGIAKLDVSQPTVSHHLAILRDARLVNVREAVSELVLQRAFEGGLQMINSHKTRKNPGMQKSMICLQSYRGGYGPDMPPGRSFAFI